MSENVLFVVTTSLFAIVIATLGIMFALYGTIEDIQYSLGENHASIENIESDISELKEFFKKTTNVLLET